MEKKYIIEVEKGERIYRASVDRYGLPSLSFIGSIDDLTPYTAPDLEQVNAEKDKIYDEARARGYDEGRARGYQEGLFDAWVCARKIVCRISDGGYTQDLLDGIFGSRNYQSIMAQYSASDAVEKISKYEKYEPEQEEKEIQVGDEVKAFERKSFIVTGFGYGDEDTVYCHGFVTENGISTIAKKDECVKTGRHFPGIAEVLREHMQKTEEG